MEKNAFLRNTFKVVMMQLRCIVANPKTNITPLFVRICQTVIYEFDILKIRIKRNMILTMFP